MGTSREANMTSTLASGQAGGQAGQGTYKGTSANVAMRRVGSAPYLTGKRSVGGAPPSGSGSGQGTHHPGPPHARPGTSTVPLATNPMHATNKGSATTAASGPGSSCMSASSTAAGGVPLRFAVGMIGGASIGSGGGSYHQRMQAYRLHFG